VSEHGRRNKLMLVGHEPDFSKVVGRLIGNGQVVMKKGGLAIVELTDVESLQGRLLCVVPPNMLESTRRLLHIPERHRWRAPALSLVASLVSHRSTLQGVGRACWAGR